MSVIVSVPDPADGDVHCLTGNILIEWLKRGWRRPLLGNLRNEK
jgi:hypothetical protein